MRPDAYRETSAGRWTRSEGALAVNENRGGLPCWYGIDSPNEDDRRCWKEGTWTVAGEPLIHQDNRWCDEHRFEGCVRVPVAPRPGG